MNKVDKILEDIEKYREKKEKQIKKIQKKCVHKNTHIQLKYHSLHH
jgi:hypothetical protein